MSYWFTPLLLIVKKGSVINPLILPSLSTVSFFDNSFRFIKNVLHIRPLKSPQTSRLGDVVSKTLLFPSNTLKNLIKNVLPAPCFEINVKHVVFTAGYCIIWAIPIRHILSYCFIVSTKNLYVVQYFT